MVQLVLAAIAVVPFLVLDLFLTPEGVRWMADRAQRGLPFHIGIDDFVPLPTGDWRQPNSWRFLVSGFTFEPPNPKAPTFSLDRATLGLEVFRRPDGRWEIDIGDGVVTGLAIEARQQRPPPPWEVQRLAVARVSAKRVRIRDARFTAPRDEPLGAVEAIGLVGVLNDVVFDPGTREVSAEGYVTGERFTTGAITLHRVNMEVFRLVKSSLHLEGSFVFADAPATVVGDISTFHIKSAVDLSVAIDRLSLDAAVQAATGRSSPIEGRLGLRLRVTAGGDLPRGGSVVEGTGTLREGKIQLGPRTRYLVLDILTLAPWVEVGEDRKVRLADMRGRLRFERGLASLIELTYPAGQRTLQLDGSVSGGVFHSLVRLLPLKNRDTRPGLGVVLEGGKDEGMNVRLATKDDVFRERPWLPPSDEERAAIEAQRAERRAALAPKPLFPGRLRKAEPDPEVPPPEP